MREYLFVLGRDFELSLAEIISYFTLNKISFELKEYNRQYALFLLSDINFDNLINRLGGTVKIAGVKSDGINKEYIEDLFYGITCNKVIISFLSLTRDNISENFLDEIKKVLRQNKIKFVIKTDASPSKIVSLGILEKGFDFVFFNGRIARTICVSNPKIFEKRERQRPNNDFLRGTSLRLSKILINISGAKKGQTILDPFCGLGIIIEEGLFLDCNVLGVEKDARISKKARENLQFFTSKYNLKNKFKIINGDSRNIDKMVKDSYFDVVVSEPYLGPYIKNTYTFEQAKKVCLELESLYKSFFKGLSSIVKNQRIVMIFPRFMTKEGRIIGPNIKQMLYMGGFKIDGVGSQVKIPIRYGDKKSKIIRDIYVFRKK